MLDITGTLDLSALGAGGTTIKVDTLLPGGGTNPGPMANFNESIGYDWEFVRTSAGVSGFDAANFQFDADGFANPHDGTFEVAMQGNSLYIVYTASMAFPDPDVSTVVASPTSIPADGVSTSTITVTLKNADGNAVPGRDVTLANTAGPGVADIDPAGSVTTDAAGVATFTVSSTTSAPRSSRPRMSPTASRASSSPRRPASPSRLSRRPR